MVRRLCRKKTILVKLSEIEYQVIEAAAKAAGITKTEFVRNAAKRIAQGQAV